MASTENENIPGVSGDSLETTPIETILKLEEIEKYLYRAAEENLWQPLYGGAVFGGQVVGQALMAAGKTIPDGLNVHSLHCYFVRPGNPNRPILYHVENICDGTRFGTRVVKATQSGKTILTMMASFHKLEPSYFSHQYTMPETPPPEQLVTYTETNHKSLEEGLLPENCPNFLKKVTVNKFPTEIKPVFPTQNHRIIKYGPHAPYNLFWIRAKRKIQDTTGHIHQCFAAYMSDFVLLITSILPLNTPNVTFLTSLDHSIWFHDTFHANEWMLYETESPRMTGGRALTVGRLWKRDGTLVVSVAQEGVVRLNNQGKL